MGWFRTFRMNRAARQYAKALPSQMQKGWGVAEHYTPQQINTAVRQLGLDARYIGLAYAAFLAEDVFNALRAELPVPVSYDEARTAFRRYLPSRPVSAAWNPLKGDPAVNPGFDSHIPP